MTDPDIYRRSWSSVSPAIRLACPNCETDGRLEKRTGDMAKCHLCGHVFETSAVLKIDKYHDPNFVKKAHDVARAYHRMRGDLAAKEAD